MKNVDVESEKISEECDEYVENTKKNTETIAQISDFLNRIIGEKYFQFEILDSSKITFVKKK